MRVTISNCNNIDTGTLDIEPGRLNIKYAINGTGKSTIAKAIELKINNHTTLSELTPFKYRNGNKDNPTPKVEGLDGISSFAIFNENYINQFAFKQDELLANSFDIFVKTQEYDTRMLEIENIIVEIKRTFSDSPELDQMILDLTTLSECFGKSKTGYSNAGSIEKGIGKGNKITNIPAGLEGYKAFLQCESNVQWIRWQLGGKEFLNLSDDCPYCTSPTKEKTEVILRVEKEYDAKSIEHLTKVISVLSNLKKYFSDTTNQTLANITTNSCAISEEEKNYLIILKSEIDTLKQKLGSLKNLGFFALKDVDKLSSSFGSYKIDLQFLPHLDSDPTKQVVNLVNAGIDTILAKAGILQGEINKQKASIQKTIREHSEDINTFLRSAGYRYTVNILEEGSGYKLKLIHQDCQAPISGGSQHLSYGEKNAFSLVLFMYESVRKQPDLIILDDPISSFDKNKKYAIVDMLFRRKNSLKGRTVVLMTHDPEPVIDMIYNLPHHFEPVPFAHHLDTQGGILRETQITKSDINSFGAICKNALTRNIDDIVKLIYMRRHCEIANNRGVVYELLSNLFHKREIPEYKSKPGAPAMTEQEVSEATEEIRRQIPTFDYGAYLDKLNDDAYISGLFMAAENNYEKVQLFRIHKGASTDSSVVNKFINETFHIENEMIMQLDPSKYNTTPQYIVDICEQLIQSH